MTQKTLVLEHLLHNDHLTPLQAIGVYGIYRLAARVYELNKILPHPLTITTQVVADARGKRYARYRLFAKDNSVLYVDTAAGTVRDSYELDNSVDINCWTFDYLLQLVERKKAA